MTKKTLNPFLQVFVLTFFTLSLLSACFKEKEPEIPFDELMRNAKQAMVDVEFGKVDLEMKLSGKDEKEEVQATGQLNLAFNRSGENEAEQVDFKAEGQFGSKEDTSQAEIEFTFLNLQGRVQDEHYLLLNKINITGNPDFDSIKPMIQIYLGKWFKIPQELLPATFQEFQLQKDLSQEQRALARQIFVSTQLFSLKEYHGVEKVGDRQTYHYTVTLDSTGVENYYREVAKSGGSELTEEELKQATAGLKYVESLELWIDTENYRILQGNLILSGEDLLQNSEGKPFQMSLNVAMKGDFNTSVELKAPEEAQDLDALLPFVQAAQLPAVQKVELEEDVMENTPVSEETPAVEGVVPELGE